MLKLQERSLDNLPKIRSFFIYQWPILINSTNSGKLYILKGVNGRMDRRQKIPFIKNRGGTYEKS